MKPNRSKLVESLRQLEITHSTQHYPRALSNALMEVVDAISRPKAVFRKFGKPKNHDAMWRNMHRIQKFLDPIQQ